MQTFGKYLFLTLGCSLLFLILVFWLVLYQEIVTLDHLVTQLADFRFVGYNIAEIMGFPDPSQVGEAIFRLKVYLLVIGVLSAFLFIGVSYLGSFRKQIKISALWIAFLGFFMVFGFWSKLIDDEKIIGDSDQSILLGFTLLTYLPSSLFLWLGIREQSDEQDRFIQQKKDDWRSLQASNSPSKSTEEKEGVGLDSPLDPQEEAEDDSLPEDKPEEPKETEIAQGDPGVQDTEEILPEIAEEEILLQYEESTTQEQENQADLGDSLEDRELAPDSKGAQEEVIDSSKEIEEKAEGDSQSEVNQDSAR